jgi:alpha-tubulin suppressor-like RCC1 family protein
MRRSPVKKIITLAALTCALGATDAQAALRVRQIAVGAQFVCALTVERDIKCWGDNAYGQLGLGNTADRGDDANEMGDALPFVDIASSNSTTAIEAGSTHVCAIFGKGVLKCWGGNARGQLGLGDQQNRGNNANEMGTYLPGVDVAPGLRVTQVAVGGQHSCAILDDGSVKCWGLNAFGELGAGNSFNRGDHAMEMGPYLSPLNLGTGRTAVRIEAGHDHTCVQLDNDSIKCWGWNDAGQLGLGDENARGDNGGEMGNNLPAVGVGAFVEPPSRLGAGGFHSCAIMGSILRCWGENTTGQLGLGDNQSRGDDGQEMGIWLPAIEVGVGRTPVQVEGGAYFTCTRFANERVKCWGANDQGQLGYGDALIRGLDPDDMGDNLPFIDLGS